MGQAASDIYLSKAYASAAQPPPESHPEGSSHKSSAPTVRKKSESAGQAEQHKLERRKLPRRRGSGVHLLSARSCLIGSDGFVCGSLPVFVQFLIRQRTWECRKMCLHDRKLIFRANKIPAWIKPMLLDLHVNVLHSDTVLLFRVLKHSRLKDSKFVDHHIDDDG
uniref:Non-specific serine/threonine protein kinase n=1 Tax=Oryza glumipatula TaxID=40148 RepID=A0A0D9YGQ8_9ORYZ